MEAITAGSKTSPAYHAELPAESSHVKSSQSGCNATALSQPVTLYKALEAELILEDTVHQLAVLACVTVVDLVVRAHD